MTLITRDQLRAWECCYSDAELAALLPEEGVTPLQVLDSGIPFAERLWVLARSEVIPTGLPALVSTLNRMTREGRPDAEMVEVVRASLMSNS